MTQFTIKLNNKVRSQNRGDIKADKLWSIKVDL
jgi:hypothetical protein